MKDEAVGGENGKASGLKSCSADSIFAVDDEADMGEGSIKATNQMETSSRISFAESEAAGDGFGI